MPVKNIQLPDGSTRKIEVPEGATEDQILGFVKQQWEAGAFSAPKEDSGFSLEGAIEDIAPGFLGSAERTGEALTKTGEFLTPEPSTAGSIIGAIAGSPLGVPGMMGGGAVGATLGQAYEEYQKPGDMTFDNYWNAFQEGLISLGIDAATFGAGKAVTPMFRRLLESYQKIGKTPLDAAREVAELGTEESFRRTQKILSDGNATLTPTAFPNMSRAETIKESFGRAGLLSGRRFDENAAKVNQVVTDNFNQLFDPKFSVTNEDLGGAIYQIINQGKAQLGNSYRLGLDEVQASLKPIAVSGKPAAARLKNYLNSLATDVRLIEKKIKKDVTVGIGPRAKTTTITKTKQVPEKFYGTTDPDTVTLIKDAIKDLDKVSEMSASSLVEMQKNMMTLIERKGTFGDPLYNPKAAADLAEFSRVYREAIQTSVANANPKAALALKQLNKEFSEGLDQLIPPINKGFMTRASNGSVEALGKIMASQGQNLNAKNLLNSVRVAFREASKDPKALEVMPFKTEKEAIDAVRSSYIKELMPKVDTGLDVKDYKNLATKFTNKERRAKAKEILGDKFVPFMDLLNVMAQASKTETTGSIPQLIIRSKEYQAAGIAMGATVGGAAAGAISGPAAAAGALAIFTLPEILAKAATDPRHVNRIKGFSKTNFDTAAEMMEKFSLIANDIMAQELSQYLMNDSTQKQGN
jgi:hypothetical protein